MTNQVGSIYAGNPAPINIHDVDYASATVVSSNTWAVGAYRRLEIKVKRTAGSSTSLKVKFVGPSTSTYYCTAVKVSSTVTGSASNGQDNFTIDLSDGAGNMALNMNAEIVNGVYRTVSGLVNCDTGEGRVFTGVCIDTTHDITGVVVTFTTACDGRLTVVGYK